MSNVYYVIKSDVTWQFSIYIYIYIYIYITYIFSIYTYILYIYYIYIYIYVTANVKNWVIYIFSGYYAQYKKLDFL